MFVSKVVVYFSTQYKLTTDWSPSVDYEPTFPQDVRTLKFEFKIYHREEFN